MLDKAKQSIIILHGQFEQDVFDLLEEKKAKDVFILEGRPGFESSQASSRELLKRNIKPTLIADNMAGFLFYKGLVKEVWLAYQVSNEKGALCQVGSLVLGVLGSKHKVPVYCFPASQSLKLMGKQRDVFYFNGIKVAPNDIQGYVPLMEWVENKYITQVNPELVQI